MKIIEDFLKARAEFQTAMTQLQMRGEDTTSYAWNSEVADRLAYAHMRDFKQAYSPEEREALWAWYLGGSR